ncbi:MAG: hypothetical protein KJ061_17685 [Vicinamibacteraceae bacterium]|nr:hypothetical protein [Vicinamibacteraceae bacterium]
MLRTPFRLAVLTSGLLACAPGGESRLTAQVTPHVERAVDESGLTITCEVFCSETKLRTANARIRWHVTRPGGPEAATLATAKQSLQTTVFHQGFEKNLYVTLPVGGATPGRPVEAAGQAQAQRPLRAFQIALIETEKPRPTEAGTTEMGVVVENLEPGMMYTWRVVAEAAGGRLTTPTVTCEAPVCPADMADQAPPPKPQPRRRPRRQP